MGSFTQTIATVFILAIFALIYFLGAYLGIYTFLPWLASINILLIILLGIVMIVAIAILSRMVGLLILGLYLSIENKILKKVINWCGWGICIATCFMLAAAVYGSFTPFSLNKLFGTLVVLSCTGNMMWFFIGVILNEEE